MTGQTKFLNWRELSVVIFAASLAGLGVSSVVTPQHLWVWKLSVLSKEFGHWFALLSLIAMFFSLYILRAQWRIFSVLINCLSIVAFATPVYSAFSEISGFQSDFKSGFHTLAKTPNQNEKDWISIPRLFLGWDDTIVAYQRKSFDETNGESLTLDFYPPQNAIGPAPWIMVIHGGGWDSGDSTQLPELNSHLANRGYGVVSINYRLAPKWQWPAPKDDALKAVAYVQMHASEMKLDPDRWAILGRSAGGQIAGALAYSMVEHGPRGLVSMYAPTEMVFGYEAGDEDDILESRGLMRRYMGGAPFDRLESYHSASPIDLIQVHPVPTLLVHGKADMLVWHKHSERLATRLRLAGIPAVLIDMSWATHGMDYSLKGPGGQISTSAIDEFLALVL